MGKRAKTETNGAGTNGAGTNGAAPEPSGDHPGADLSLVLPLSLLSGGLVSYPALSAAAEGTGDLMKAITVFLATTLVAMIGIGINILLFRSWAAKAADGPAHAASGSDASPSPGTVPGDGTGAEPAEPDGEGPVPTLAIERELDSQAQDIDQALAATDALLHEQSTPS